MTTRTCILNCAICNKQSVPVEDSNLGDMAKQSGFIPTINQECAHYFFCHDCMEKIAGHIEAIDKLLENMKYPHFGSLVRAVRGYRKRNDVPEVKP